MRKAMMAATALVALAACGKSGPPDPVIAGAAAHENLLAGLKGRYIRACRLTGEGAAAPWQFVLQRQAGPRQEVLLLQAGQAPSRPLEVKKDGAARLYTLRDGTEVTVAADGEAWARGPGGSMGKIYTTGWCTKGEQPA